MKEKESDRGESNNSKSQTCSPRTVLDALEGQSNSTEDDTFSTRVSSITDTPSTGSKMKSQCNILRKPQSPFRFIASLLASPLRRKNSKKSQNEKRQPLLKCFSYEEICNATNGFHQGKPKKHSLQSFCNCSLFFTFVMISHPILFLI